MLLYRDLEQCLLAKDFASFRKIFEENQDGLNIDQPCNFREETLLDIATKNGSTEFVKFLLSKNANVNRINTLHNRAPIHFAIDNRHLDTLMALLEHDKIDPNLEVCHQTALHFAVRKHDLVSVKLLLDHNADINVVDNKGLTPLHLAAMRGQHDMVKLILDNRNNKEIKTYEDYNGKTLENYMDTSDIAKFFNNTSPTYQDLKYDIFTDSEESFLQKITSLDISKDQAEQLLLVCAKCKLNKAASAILKLHKNLDLMESAEWSIIKYNSDLLQMILEINSKLTGHLLLYFCQQFPIPTKQMEDALKCLNVFFQQKYIDVNQRDGKLKKTKKLNLIHFFFNYFLFSAKGNTPLDYAVKYKCDEAVRLIVQRGGRRSSKCRCILV